MAILLIFLGGRGDFRVGYFLLGISVETGNQIEGPIRDHKF